MDLGAEASASKNAVMSEEKSVKDLAEQLKTLPPRDPTRTRVQRELSAAERNLTRHRQNLIYYEVRREQRQAFDRETYAKAFEEDKPWPKPNEFAEYKKVKQLRAAPMSWDQRVPKLTRYSKQAPTPIAEKAKSSAGGGGAPH